MQIFDKLDNFNAFIASGQLFFEYVFDPDTHSLRKDPRYHINDIFSRICSAPTCLKVFLAEYHKCCYPMYIEFFRTFSFQYASLCKYLRQQERLKLLIFILRRLDHAYFQRTLISKEQLFDQYERLLKCCLTIGTDLQILFETSRNFEKYCKSEYSTIQFSSRLLKRDEFLRNPQGKFAQRKFEYILNLHEQL